LTLRAGSGMETTPSPHHDDTGKRPAVPNRRPELRPASDRLVAPRAGDKAVRDAARRPAAAARGRAGETPARPAHGSRPHEAFDFAFGPGQRLLHRLALAVAHAHLGQRRLR